jgi:putative spermidine/putrescine transport system permease protein
MQGTLILDRRRIGRWLLNGAAGLAFLYILLPLIFITWLSFYSQEIPSYPPEGYTLHWFGAITGNDRFINGLLLSLQLGVIATALGLLVSVPAALCIANYRFRGR